MTAQYIADRVSLKDAEGETIDPASEPQQKEIGFLLRRIFHALAAPAGFDVSSNRMRTTTALESGTVTTVSTVTSVSNIVSLGGQPAQMVSAGQDLTAWCLSVRSKIT